RACATAMASRRRRSGPTPTTAERGLSAVALGLVRRSLGEGGSLDDDAAGVAVVVAKGELASGAVDWCAECDRAPGGEDDAAGDALLARPGQERPQRRDVDGRRSL